MTSCRGDAKPNKPNRNETRTKRAEHSNDSAVPQEDATTAAQPLLADSSADAPCSSGLVWSGLWSTSGTLTSGSRRQAKRGASSRLSQGKQAKGPDASHSFRASWPGLGLGWAGRSTAQRLGSSPKRPVARGIIHSSASCMATHARRTRSRARRR